MHIMGYILSSYVKQSNFLVHPQYRNKDVALVLEIQQSFSGKLHGSLFFTYLRASVKSSTLRAPRSRPFSLQKDTQSSLRRMSGFPRDFLQNLRRHSINNNGFLRGQCIFIYKHFNQVLNIKECCIFRTRRCFIQQKTSSIINSQSTGSNIFNIIIFDIRKSRLQLRLQFSKVSTLL